MSKFYRLSNGNFHLGAPTNDRFPRPDRRSEKRVETLRRDRNQEVMTWIPKSTRAKFSGHSFAFRWRRVIELGQPDLHT